MVAVNPIDVEVVRPADPFAELVEVFDDGVAAFHVALPDGNSTGVRIIGGRKSEERQIASNRYYVWPRSRGACSSRSTGLPNSL